MDYKKLIEKLVDVSQVPFAAAYLNNDGDICEYGPYQINFAHEVPHIPLFTKEQLNRFAELAVAAEREACAKVCDNIDLEYEHEDVLASWCAAAIRERMK